MSSGWRVSLISGWRRIVPVDELGIPTYDELVLVANSDDLAEAIGLLRLQPFNRCPMCGLNGGRSQHHRVLCDHSWHERSSAVITFLARMGEGE